MTTPNVGKNIEQLKLSYTLSENVSSIITLEKSLVIS